MPTVRELITKVKFQLDKASLAGVNSAIRNLKKNLAGIGAREKNIKFKTSGLDTAIRGLSRVKTEINSLSGKVANVRVKAVIDPLRRKTVMNTIGNQASMMSQAGGAVAGVGRGLVAAAGAYGGYLGASEVVETADAMMSLDGRLRTVTQSEHERLWIESELYAMGQKTRQQMNALGDLYFKVARASEEMGFAQADNLKVTETVSKALVVGGASAAEANATILQLGQALGSGRLQGDELRSLDENASALMRHVAKYFNTTVAGLKEMGRQGELTSEEVMRAILSSSDAINQEFANMPMTFSQSMNVMRNSWDRFVLGVEQKSNIFSTFARGASKAFESLDEQFQIFLTLMGTPNADKMVEITDRNTGERRQISEADYYTSKREENPGLARLAETLKNLGEWFDRLDGKWNNADEQIGNFIEKFLKIGAVVAPLLAIISAFDVLYMLISPLITALSPLFGWLAGLLGGATLGGIATVAGPVVAALLAIGAAAYFIYDNWDTVKELLAPLIGGVMGGFQALGETLENLGEIWDNLYPVIEPVIDALLQIVKIFGGLFSYSAVAMLYVFFGGFVFVFNGMAKLIKWVTELLANLTKHISEIGAGLSGLIDKAKSFLGFNSDITAMNEEIMAGMEAGANQNSVNQSQSNVYNIPSMDALPAAQSASNSWFNRDYSEFE